MGQITIENLNNKEISNTDNSKSVLDIIHESGIDWMHACGKKGRCTTCKIIVVEGADQLSPIEETEQLLFDAGKLHGVSQIISGRRRAVAINLWDSPPTEFEKDY